MTIQAVADTHALLWYLYNDPRLSVTAGKFMDKIDQDGDQIAITPITLAEMVYLIEKGKIPVTSFDRVITTLTRMVTIHPVGNQAFRERDTESCYDKIVLSLSRNASIA